MLAEMTADIENIRTAWQWASQHQQWHLLAGALDSFGRFHEWQGYYHLGEKTLALLDLMW